MATTYEPNTKLGKPATGDLSWGSLVLNPNADTLEAMAPLAGLNVSLHEIPSTSLNVRVASGSYRKHDGTLGTYAGSASTAITTATTKVLYLDGSGALQVAASYPATTYTPLATVVAGATTITSITDNRASSSHVLFTSLGNYANDGAAATGGVAVGALYRNGSVLMVRVT